MQSRDIAALTGAVVIVLLVALLARPALTGEDTEIWFPPEGPPTATPTPHATDGGDTSAHSLPPAETPTPRPTWSGTEQELAFVDPGTYRINFTTSGTPIQEPPADIPPGNVTMKPFATISASGSGTSEIFYIPAPYWVIDLSISPYNQVFSAFDLDLLDADDPNRAVNHGHIGLYGHDFIEGEAYESTHTIYEGYRRYYLVIETRSIRSYTITIRIPVEGPEGL